MFALNRELLALRLTKLLQEAGEPVYVLFVHHCPCQKISVRGCRLQKGSGLGGCRWSRILKPRLNQTTCACSTLLLEVLREGGYGVNTDENLREVRTAICLAHQMVEELGPSPILQHAVPTGPCNSARSGARRCDCFPADGASRQDDLPE